MGRTKLTIPRFHIKTFHAYFNSAAIVEFKIKKGMWCDFKLRKNHLCFIFNKKYQGVPCNEPTKVNQSILSIKKRFKKMNIPVIQGTYDFKYSKARKLWYIRLKGVKNAKKQRRRATVS